MSSDNAWRRWGETDPYYGVLADARFRRDAIADHKDAFWSSGDVYLREQLHCAELHCGAVVRGRALDFGCGVGRLSIPMARQFEEVVALDVAPAMIEEARRNAVEAGVANLDIQMSDDMLSAAPGRFDLVMSCMVLQHIPVRRGMPIIQRLLERTAQGGLAALHVCVDRTDTVFSGLRYRIQCSVPGAHGLINILRGRRFDEPFMQMNAYPLQHILQLSRSLGFGPAVVTCNAHGRFQTAQILMRRYSDAGGQPDSDVG